MMKFSIFVFALIVLISLTSCKATTFIISKDGKAYYLGRDSRLLREMLCKDGELASVLSDTKIDPEIQKQILRYHCTEEHSKEKIVSLYQFLSPEEREELKNSFRNHGYTINHVPC
jgi:hypothetical protein